MITMSEVCAFLKYNNFVQKKILTCHNGGREEIPQRSKPKVQ